MFLTKWLSEDTKDLYVKIRRSFEKEASTKMMRTLLANRKYNIQLIGPAGAGKSSFVQTLLTNTFDDIYRPGAIPQGSIAFPTNLGKVVFNISECRYSIHSINQPNLAARVRQEWENMDAFFVMFKHGNRLSFDQCNELINNIRRVLNRRDIPIVLVELQCDVPGEHDLQTDIEQLCVLHGPVGPPVAYPRRPLVCEIKHVEVSSRRGTNIHVPFLALQDSLKTYFRNIVGDVPNIPITPLLLLPPPVLVPINTDEDGFVDYEE